MRILESVRFSVVVVAFGLLLAIPIIASAQTEVKQSAVSAPEWKSTAGKAGLSAEEIVLLEKQKVIFTGKNYQQIFLAYDKDLKGPVFITADSLLNTFHVLFEQAVFATEAKRARQLPAKIRQYFSAVKTASPSFSMDSKLKAESHRRALITVGVALRLLDDQPIDVEPAILREIEAESKRVTSALGRHKPEWLGAPDPGFKGIDYTQFRPTGRYTRTRSLERYYRAVRWMQAIPFRIEFDSELATLAFLLWNIDERSNRGEPYPWQIFYDIWESTPNSDGPGLINFGGEAMRQWQRSTSLVEFRNNVKEHIARCDVTRVNDLVVQDGGPRDATTQPAVRLIAAGKGIDAELFFQSIGHDPRKPSLPNGLAVAVLLGSSFAYEQLAEISPTLAESSKRFASVANKHRTDDANAYIAARSGASRVLAAWRSALTGLIDESDPALPKLFKSAIWRRKNCHATLASWAQMRHTLHLHTRTPAVAPGFMSEPDSPGFVEPFPEFFQGMAELARRVDTSYSVTTADRTEFALEQFGEACLTVASAWEQAVVDPKFDYKKGIAVEDEWLLLSSLTEKNECDGTPALSTPKNRNQALAFAATLRKLARSNATDFKGDSFDTLLYSYAPAFRPDWHSFEVLCLELAALGQKQLRNASWNKRERDFIGMYGSRIERMTGYSTSVVLRDDAPRVVAVFANTYTREYLHAGVGRPRQIFVLYPYKGNEILCRGAVMPYYEFPRTDRLTNDEWKRMLDAADPPKPPAWTQPLYAPNADRSNKAKGRWE